MPLNIDLQQILLHLLNFVILAGGLYFILYKPVKKFMAQREEYYMNREETSEKRLQESEKIKAAYEAKLQQADEEISQHRAQVSDELEAEKVRLLGEARDQARQIISTASKTAEMRSKKALADSNKEIQALAIEAVQKLLLSEGDALDTFLDAAESEQFDE